MSTSLVLTARRKELLKYLKRYIKRHGYAPTIKEMGEHLQLASTSSIHRHLTKLESLGLIKRYQDCARAIELVQSNDEKLKDEKVLEIPIVGTIAAGRPISARLESSTTYITKDMKQCGGISALQVEGDWLKSAGIFDQDLLIVSPVKVADSGQVVIALLDGKQIIVKKYYHEKARVRLQAINDRDRPLILDNHRVQIQGVVIGIIRRY